MPRIDLPKGNAIIGQSGGPTAVINQSLVSAVMALRATLHKRGIVKKIYGMRHGVNGLVKDDVVDLTRTSAAHLSAIAKTPAAALGSSRDKPDRDYCQQILNACKARDVRYFFYIGGNDSSDTCRIVSELAQESGSDLRCFHIPKTIDNDLMGSDHTPGFPSSARFQALAFMSDSLDNASLPGIKINIVMGRNAGFLTAASALARGTRNGPDAPYTGHNGPHLIYLPELHVNRDTFLADVDAVYTRLGRCQIAVSEGVTDPNGKPIVATLLDRLQTDAHGNIQLSGVGAHGDALAELVQKNLKPKGGKSLRVRADTFGYLQRCWPDPSPVDVKEARLSAAHAVRLAVQGHHSGSVAILRKKGRTYAAEFARIELLAVAGKTRRMPAEFIRGHNDVSAAFLDYCRPLVGALPVMARL